MSLPPQCTLEFYLNVDVFYLVQYSFHHHPPYQVLPLILMSPKRGLTTQRTAIQSKVVLTIYTIQLQRSTLAGLVHFVQGICIFLWDENAIN